MKLGWYYSATALDPYECPTLEAQLAACKWAEDELERQRVAKLEAERKAKAPPPPPTSRRTIFRPLTRAFGMGSQSLFVQHALSATAMKSEMLAAQEELRREVNAAAREARAMTGMTDVQFGETSWWDKQPKPPERPGNVPRARKRDQSATPQYMTLAGHVKVYYDPRQNLYVCLDCGLGVTNHTHFEKTMPGCDKRFAKGSK